MTWRGRGLQQRGHATSWLRAAILAAPWCSCITALAATTPHFPPDPIPRIEVGVHTAFIKKLSVSADGKILVTVSDDKTARVWEASSGKLRHPAATHCRWIRRAVVRRGSIANWRLGGCWGFHWPGRGTVGSPLRIQTLQGN